MITNFLKYVCFGLLAVATVACNNDSRNDTSDLTTDSSTTELDENGMTRVPTPVVKAGKYVDLTTGEEIEVIADPVTGIALNSKTQIPVQFYYDPITLDTIYQNGLVVNTMLIKEGDGKYRLDDMKIKIDGDEIKIKTDSSKLKIDGGDMKFKSGDNKIKTDDDEFKAKDANGKVKIDDGEIKTKPTN
jgi:hypothetical protein